MLRWVYWWNSTEDSPETISEELVLLQLKTDFKTDFSAKGLSSEELAAIEAAWQAGAISRETMFDLFRRGEVLPPGRTDEEECRLTEKQKAKIGKAEMQKERQSRLTSAAAEN